MYHIPPQTSNLQTMNIINTWFFRAPCNLYVPQINMICVMKQNARHYVHPFRQSEKWVPAVRLAVATTLLRCNKEIDGQNDRHDVDDANSNTIVECFLPIPQHWFILFLLRSSSSIGSGLMNAVLGQHNSRVHGQSMRTSVKTKGHFMHQYVVIRRHGGQHDQPCTLDDSTRSTQSIRLPRSFS